VASSQQQSSLDRNILLIQMMNDIMLQFDNNQFIGTVAPFMFDMSLVLFILIKSVAQKRLIVENCIYSIVTNVIKNIDEHSESGTWSKLTNSLLLRKIFTHYKKMYTENNNDEKLDLFSFHILNLHESMRKVDHILLARHKLDVESIKPKERVDELIQEMQNIDNANL
jgi:hypothetical protein